MTNDLVIGSIQFAPSAMQGISVNPQGVGTLTIRTSDGRSFTFDKDADYICKSVDEHEGLCQQVKESTEREVKLIRAIKECCITALECRTDIDMIMEDVFKELGIEV